MIPSKLPDLSAPSQLPKKSDSLTFRIEKVVTKTLDNAATSILDISKLCWTAGNGEFFKETGLIGAIVFYIFFLVPAGIASGIGGGILLGLEKISEAISGGKPISLNDSFDDVVEASEKRLQTNEKKGWLSKDSTTFLRHLQAEFQSVRADYLVKKVEWDEKLNKSEEKTNREIEEQERLIREVQKEAREKLAEARKEESIIKARQEIEKEKETKLKPLRAKIEDLRSSFHDLKKAPRLFLSNYNQAITTLKAEYRDFIEQKRHKA